MFMGLLMSLLISGRKFPHGLHNTAEVIALVKVENFEEKKEIESMNMVQ